MDNDNNNEQKIRLIFLHGAGLNRCMWLLQMQKLAKFYALEAIDLPGHGAERDSDFTMESAIAAVHKVADVSDGSKSVIVGLSLGGYVAICYAARYPERVAGLVLSGCCVQYKGLIALVAKANLLLMNFLPRSLLAKMQVRILSIIADNALKQAILSAGLSVRAAKQGLQAVIAENFLSLLTVCQMPILILNGSEDSLNRKYEVIVRKAARHSTLQTIVGASHLCNLEYADEYTSAVQQFVTQLSLMGCDS